MATDLTGDGYPDLALPGNTPAAAGTSGYLATRIGILVNTCTLTGDDSTAPPYMSGVHENAGSWEHQGAAV